MKFRTQLKEVLGPLRKTGVLETGYTLQELTEEMEKREDALDELEREAERHYRKEKRFRQKQKDAVGRRKERFKKKAEIHERRRRVYEKVHKVVMRQQHLLNNLVSHAREKRILENPKDELGLSIDLSNLDERKVARAIEDSRIDIDSHGDGLEEIEAALDWSNPDTVNSYHDPDDQEEYSIDHEFEDELDAVIDEELGQLGNDSKTRDTDKEGDL